MAPTFRGLPCLFLVSILLAQVRVEAAVVRRHGNHSQHPEVIMMIKHPDKGLQMVEHPEVEEKKEGEEGKQEAHAGEEERTEMLETAYALTLMGGVTVVMSLFYLVNSQREEVAKSTWRVLNMTISIFLAVLIFGMMHEVIKAGMELKTHLAIPKSMSLVVFVVTYLAMQSTLYLCMLSKAGSNVKAAGTIFAHLSGFAATFLVAELQFEEIIRHSAFLTLCVALGAGFLLCVLNLVASEVRQHMIDADGKVDEEEEVWQDAIDDAEKDMLSLAFGFALMQTMRKCITGHAEPFEPDEPPEGIKQWEVDALLVCAAIFAGVIVASGRACKLVEAAPKHSLQRRFVEAMPSSASMAMAWSMLFWGEWQIYVLGFEGVRIAGCMLVALAMTIVAIILIFALDYLKSNSNPESTGVAIRELVVALGLMVGFTWERSFDMGLDAISEMHGDLARVAKHVLPLALVIVVFPAWSKYVLPKASDD